MNVFLNGCFDLTHTGHINLLLEARRLAQAGHVIVALDEDELVMATKGLRRPVFTVHERAKALLDLAYGDVKIVDRVEFFPTNQIFKKTEMEIDNE